MPHVGIFGHGFTISLDSRQSHSSEVHTPAGVPDAPLTAKSMKLPAATATAPVAVQLAPLATAQLSAVSASAPGNPLRRVTVTVFDCCEKTSSRTAEHPLGTHASTAADSLAEADAAFTA